MTVQSTISTEPLLDDVESGSLSGSTSGHNSFSDKLTHRDFIINLYAILSLQLALAFSFCGFCLYFEPAKHYLMVKVIQHLWVFVGVLVLAMTVYIVIICVFACSMSTVRTYPMNYIFLSLFTVSNISLLGVICSRYRVEAILMGIGFTLICTLTVSLLSCFTSFNITKLVHFLVIVFLVLALSALVFTFYRNPMVNIIYAALGCLLVMLYFAFGTEMIIGVNSIEISPEECIFATMCLYFSIFLCNCNSTTKSGKDDNDAPIEVCLTACFQL